MSRIEQVITEIEEFVNRCKTVALSNSIIKVNKEEFVALLNELRQEIPEEVTQSQKVISNKESILLDAKDKAVVAATTDYVVHIDAAVEYGNVFGCQFHPEKSSEIGLKILKNFLEV